MLNGNSIEMKIPYILIMVLITTRGEIATICQEFSSYEASETARKHIANELDYNVKISSQGVYQK